MNKGLTFIRIHTYLVLDMKMNEGIHVIRFGSFSGIIVAIEDMLTGADEIAGCYKRVTVQNGEDSVVNFIVSPATYFVNQYMLKTGDAVIGFYDLNAPVPLIYPPQYHAIVMAERILGMNVKADYFNDQLVSSDGLLKLHLHPMTQILLRNGQTYTGNPGNHNLIVVYGPTTRSIPAQTTPYSIIVMCI